MLVERGRATFPGAHIKNLRNYRYHIRTVGRIIGAVIEKCLQSTRFTAIVL